MCRRRARRAPPLSLAHPRCVLGWTPPLGAEPASVSLGVEDRLRAAACSKRIEPAVHRATCLRGSASARVSRQEQQMGRAWLAKDPWTVAAIAAMPCSRASNLRGGHDLPNRANSSPLGIPHDPARSHSSRATTEPDKQCPVWPLTGQLASSHSQRGLVSDRRCKFCIMDDAICRAAVCGRVLRHERPSLPAMDRLCLVVPLHAFLAASGSAVDVWSHLPRISVETERTPLISTADTVSRGTPKHGTRTTKSRVAGSISRASLDARAR